MQLIEIVQLVLVGFVLISSLIFGASYLGYRKRAGLSGTTKKKSEKIRSAKIVVKPEPVKKVSKTVTPKVDKKIIVKKDTNTQELNVPKSKLKTNRFEVFNPAKEKEHFPKTLTIKLNKKNKS